MNEIIIDVGQNETRIAILENGELVEIYIERTKDQKLLGNIYRAKVSNVLPGMQAAFVDIGYEKNAFLYVEDVILNKKIRDREKREGYKIENLLKPGQEITVQVLKEPIGTKGPRVTTNITLPGRQLVLLPNDDYIGISKRIEDEEQRISLKEIMKNIKPEGMGIIVRTLSEGKIEDDFKEDINFLLKLWENINKKSERGNVPRCLHKDLSLVYKTIRDIFTKHIDRFIINNREEYDNILQFIDMISPELKLKVQYYQKDENIYEYYGITHKILDALSKKIWLKSGGYLIIERTEALTVVDVNTGKFVGKDNFPNTVLKTNLEAAKEIAKQLRLRDIGGIVIIDFIDMNDLDHQQLVLDALKQELKKDRTKTAVIGITGLGLIEMTRKKVRQELATALLVDCKGCKGTGKVLYKS